MREDRRLSKPAGSSDGMADDHNDGLLAQALLDAGMFLGTTALCLNGLGNTAMAWPGLLRHTRQALGAVLSKTVAFNDPVLPCLKQPDQ